MRSRVIKAQFWQDMELAALPDSVRLLFIGLWCLADREGRLPDNALLIAGNLFAARDDGIVDDVQRWLEMLATGGWITRYEAAGVRCIHIRRFRDYQPIHWSEPPSKLPPEPAHRPPVSQAAKRTAGEPLSGNGFALADAARSIWERHPRHRRGGLHQCEQAIVQIVGSAVNADDLLHRMDEAHRRWCESEEWQRANGRYVPRLDRWITERRWESVPESDEF